MVSRWFDMDRHVIEEQYLKISKRFGYLSGTWPYQKTSSKVAIIVLTVTIAVLAMATQIANIKRMADMDTMIEDFPFIVVTAGLVMKQVYCGIIYQSELKALLNGMYEDWATVRPKEEFEIMTDYAKRATYFTSFYTVSATSSALFFMNMPYVSLVMDKLIPLNETRNPKFLYSAYYPFDQTKYFYVVSNHMAVLILLILLVFTAVDTTFIYFVQHACGLLEVSGRRFKDAIHDTSICNENVVMSAETMYKNVCYSIEGHQRAMACLKEIQQIFMIFLFIFMTLVTAVFSLSLVKISALEVNGDTEFCFYCIFLFVQLMHIFFMVYQGQFVINASDNVYNQIYQGLWYNAPSRTQALYVLALRRTMNSPQITAGGLVTFSLQSFSTMMKTSFSYFTVLKSV